MNIIQLNVTLQPHFDLNHIDWKFFYDMFIHLYVYRIKIKCYLSKLNSCKFYSH